MLTEENERLTARLTALESERDALLAAAGKEAVAWFHNTAREGDKPVYEQVAEEYACPPAIPLCLCAPTAAQCTVPDGWKLVPIEPTNKMTAIGQDSLPIGLEYRRDIP
jgi:hypothetical protein